MRRLALTLVAVVVTAGCAIGVEDDAHPIDLSVAPGVLDGSVGGPDVSDPASVAMSVYLVRDNRLVHVTREAPSTGSQLEAVVTAAVAGPSATEAGSGVWSAIPPATSVRGVEVSNGVAKVDLSSDFATIGGRDEILAIGQIVLSVTAVPDMDAVSFLLDGAATSVPGPDGILVANALTAEDFLELTEP